MKKIKFFLAWVPEVYLLLAVVYYWMLTAGLFNPFAISLIALLGVQFLIKKELTGIIISSLFICLNLFLFVALRSEFSEFERGDQEGSRMMVWGSLYLGMNLVMSVTMLVKYMGVRA